jgi:hypothetical protein
MKSRLVLLVVWVAGVVAAVTGFLGPAPNHW